MATLALQAVGTAVAGPVGGAIGGLLGAAIDNFLISQFAPTQEQKGPRIDVFDVSVAQEGAPIPRVYGTTVRIDKTNIIWVGDLIEKERKQSVGSGKSKTEVVTYRYFTDIAVSICEGPIESIRKIRANGKVIYDADDSNVGESFYNDIEIYLGTSTQLPDTVIEAREGVGEVPAFINTCYVRFTRLALEDFGRQIPTFSAEVRQSATYTVGQMITDVVERANTIAEIDTSALGNQVAKGLLVKQPESVKATLDLIRLAYDVNTRITNGVIEFYPNSQPDEIVIRAEDIGASLSSEAGEFPVKINDQSGIDLPREVDVTFYDETNGYNVSTVNDNRKNSVTGTALGVNLPIAMNSSEARTVGTRELWTAWNERRSLSVNLPPRYIDVQETDRLIIDFDGLRYQIRVRDLNRGFNFIHDTVSKIQSTFTGTAQEPPYLDTSPPGEDSEGTDLPPPYFPPDMIVYYLDIPALTDLEANEVGFFISQAPVDPTVQFASSDLFVAPTEDGNYVAEVNTPILGTLGKATNALPTCPNPEVWDEVNQLNVTLNRGELDSATKQEVLAGANYCLVGDEILAFRNANQTGDFTYELTGLLRARRATFTTGHAIDDRFVLLSTGFLEYLALSQSDIGVNRYQKLAPLGADLDNITAELFVPTAESLRPFYPVHVDASRAVNNDITFTWVRRTRATHRAFSGLPLTLPDGPTFEEYEIEVYDGMNIVRTFQVSNATEQIYTEAEQIADFGSAQSSVDIIVYELNTIGMRSNSFIVTV